jgi:hypothetical protein
LAQTASPPEEDDSIVTDRPDFTESSETVPYKHTQVEVGYTATHTDTTTLHTLGEVLIRIGVKPKTELRLGFNSIAFLNTPGGNTSGFQDFTFGAKWKWCEAAKGYGLHRPQVALITALTVPSGSSVFHEHNAQPLVKLCLGWELAPKWEMGVNFNYSNVSQSGDRFDQFASSVTFGYTWSKHISTFYEIFGFIPGGYQMGNNTYVDTGVAYLLDKNTQLDARVGYGLNGVHNDYFVGVGFAKRF